MSVDDDLQIDPAIAEAMGFSGFGGQFSKKRKHDMNDTFVDPDLTSKTKTVKGRSAGKGANTLPLGSRKPGNVEPGTSIKHDEGDASGAGTVHGTLTEASGVGSDSGKADLHALRNGVVNERGDMVYFKPSFLEDPWKGLKPT